MDMEITFSQYVKSVRMTLESWMYEHAPDTFFDSRFASCEYTFEEFKDDFKKYSGKKEDTCGLFSAAQSTYHSLYLNMAQQYDGYDYYYCPSCEIVQVGNDVCDCCDETDLGYATTEQVAYYFEECEVEPDNYNFVRWVEKDIYPEWVKIWGNKIPSILEEVKACLNDLDSDPLSAVTYANHIVHCSGNSLMRDNYEGFLTPEIIDAVSQNGIANVFSQDEIDEYLNGN